MKAEWKRTVAMLAQFKPGDDVVLARVVHLEFRGQRGKVVRVVKSRGDVVVQSSIGLYRALPQNLDKAGGA